MINNDQYDYNPDYKKIYPEIKNRPDVLEVLVKSDRKMKYMEVELKQEKFIYNAETKTARFLPSREDSCDRLEEENDVQFPSDDVSTETKAIQNIQIQNLRIALHELEPDEYALILALYFENVSEEEYAKRIGISQKGVNKRRHKVLDRLRLIIEKNKKF